MLAFKYENANENGDKNDKMPFDFSPTNVEGFGFFYPRVLFCSNGSTLSDANGIGQIVCDEANDIPKVLKMLFS